MKNRNKVVIQDNQGMSWFVTKKGKLFPTNWRLQCALESALANQAEIQEKLYGKKK